MFLPLRDDNPLHRIGFQFVTLALIAACTVVWAVQAIGGDQFDAELVFRLGMIPVTVLGELRREPDMVAVTPWLTIVTSMFLHGGFMHLFGNMLYLWIFGDNVEDAMGHWRFAIFYLLCGAVAGLTHAAVEPASQIPTIGASGAVSGVLGAYFMLHPKRGVWILVFFMPMRFPAWAVLGLWIGYQVFNALDRWAGRRRGRLVRPHRRLRCRWRCWWCRCGSAACPSSTAVSAVHGDGRPTGRRLRPRAPEWGRGKSRLPMRSPIRKPTAMRRGRSRPPVDPTAARRRTRAAYPARGGGGPGGPGRGGTKPSAPIGRATTSPTRIRAELAFARSRGAREPDALAQHLNARGFLTRDGRRWTTADVEAATRRPPRAKPDP